MSIPYIKGEDHLCKYCGTSATSCNSEEYILCGNYEDQDKKEL